MCSTATCYILNRKTKISSTKLNSNKDLIQVHTYHTVFYISGQTLKQTVQTVHTTKAE